MGTARTAYLMMLLGAVGLALTVLTVAVGVLWALGVVDWLLPIAFIWLTASVDILTYWLDKRMEKRYIAKNQT